MRAYGVFQGGGAKGYAHLGALKAAEERRIEFDAVAGTSIGAVIATLVAAGFKADELLRVEGGQNHGILAFDPLDRLDPADWALWMEFRELLGGRRPGWLVRVRPVFGGLRNALRKGRDRLPSFLRLAGTRRSGEAVARSSHGAAVRLLALYVLSPKLVSKLWQDMGLTSTSAFGAWLESVLSHKVAASNPDGRVRFRDMAPLKIVATELRSGKVEVFSRRTHPDMPVVDAVMASACFPLFFRPVETSKGLYVDGGLTSNLPTWVFDHERNVDGKRLPTFGFRLVDAPTLVAPSFYPFGRYLKGLINASLGGASHLETRQIDDCHMVDLVPAIDTLAFDKVYAEAARLMEAGRTGVEEFFRSNIGPKNPSRVSVALTVAARLLRGAIDARGRPVGELVLRILLPGEEGLVRYSYASEPGVFDRLATVPEPPSPAACMQIKEPVLLDRGSLQDLRARNPMHRVEHALRGGAVRAVYAIPVFQNAHEWTRDVPVERSKPVAILVVEAELELRGAVTEWYVEDRLAACAQILGDFLMDRDSMAGDAASAEGRDDDSGTNSTSHSRLIEVADTGLLVSDRKRRLLRFDDFARLLIDRIKQRTRQVPE